MAGMATSRPVTVATSAAATPGAMAVRVAAWLSAMPAKVDMTPQTVPSSPMNGPPATAVDNTIIPFSNAMASAPAASSSTTFTASNEAVLTLVSVVRARKSVFVCSPPSGGLNRRRLGPARGCFSIGTPVHPRRGCRVGRRARRRIPRPCAGCPAGRAWSCRRQRIFWSPGARSATGGTW